MLKELRNNVLCFIFCGHVSLHSLPIILGNLEIKRDWPVSKSLILILWVIFCVSTDGWAPLETPENPTLRKLFSPRLRFVFLWA